MVLLGPHPLNPLRIGYPIVAQVCLVGSTITPNPEDVSATTSDCVQGSLDNIASQFLLASNGTVAMTPVIRPQQGQKLILCIRYNRIGA